MEITMVCPCLLGLEGLVKDELLYLEAQNIRPQNGRVVFQGGPEILARANINCRYGERILIQLGAFEAKTFEELFQQVKSLPWELWIGRQDSFPVKGRSLDSQLKSVPDCQAIVKKAVVERLRQKYRISWFEETGFARQIQFLILKDRVSVMLDTSGIGLHKRGYRANATEAPIKETLAAAMVKLSRNHPGGGSHVRYASGAGTAETVCGGAVGADSCTGVAERAGKGPGPDSKGCCFYRLWI